MGHFGTAHGWRGPKRPPSLKSVTQLYLGAVIPCLKKIQKMYKRRDITLSSADISIFHQKSATFVKFFFLWLLFMDEIQPPQGCRVTMRRQVSFYYKVPRNSWYSIDRPRKDETLRRPWSYPVVLNTGPLDWESIALKAHSKVWENFCHLKAL